MKRPTAFSALRWTLAGGAMQRLFGFVGLGIIARLLARVEDGEALFGAYQQLVSLHLVLAVMLPLGLDQLVIREKENRVAYVRALRTGLWVAWIVAAALTLSGHGTLAYWLGMGARSDLLWLVPLVLVFQVFKLGIKPLLSAEMAFRRISIAEFANTLLVMFGGAALLAVWPEAWALYLAYACGELTESVLLWRGRDPGSMARVRSNWGEFKTLLARHRRFCGVLTFDQGINSFSNNSPALLLGGLIGQGAVGLFGMANRLITVPVYLLIGAVGRITLPALAGRPEDEIQHRVLLTLRVAAAFIPPAILWLVFFAPLVVTIVLGKEWSDQAGPVLRWLGLNLVLQALFSPISIIDVLRDRPDVTLGWNLANLGVRALALALASGLGIVGAIGVYAMASAGMWLIYGGLLSWLLRAGHRRFFGAWTRFIPLWGILAAAWWGIGSLAGDSSLLALALSPLPALLYLVLVFRMDREAAGVVLRVAGRRAHQP